MIAYKILCASGVLVQGRHSDFMVCLAAAKKAKAEWMLRLPNSTLRVQIFYPNRKRAPAFDIAAAFRALSDPSIAAAVARRAADAARISPARSEARTAVIRAEKGSDFAGVRDSAFCQAGVVAPPDSPDFGNSPCGSCEFESGMSNGV